MSLTTLGNLASIVFSVFQTLSSQMNLGSKIGSLLQSVGVGSDTASAVVGTQAKHDSVLGAMTYPLVKVYAIRTQ